MRYRPDSNRIVGGFAKKFGSCTAGATVCAMMISGSTVVAGEPDVLHLTGKLFDFKQSHSDFNVITSAGAGHVAHNVALNSPDNRPLYTGMGFKVDTQWRNINGDNIAPHLALYGFGKAGEIPVVNPSTPPIGGHSAFDTYDSTLGPYGEDSNIGPAPEFVPGSDMPPLGVPAWLEDLPSQGDGDYAGTKVLTESRRYNQLRVRDTLVIDGEISLLCEGKLRLDTHSQVLLEPGATLNIYLVDGADEIGGADSWNHVRIGDPLNPHRVRIYNLSSNEVMIHNHATVYAIIFSPYAKLSLVNHGELFGLFSGLEIEFGNHGKLHIDDGSRTQLWPQACEQVISDDAGVKGEDTTAGISSVESFDQWYSDVLGVNMSIPHTITLVRDESGVYEYIDDEFFPIDNQLFGNEGFSRNFFFTYTFVGSFEYLACENLFFEFAGADDAWVYIDGELVLDLGGLIPMMPQVVELDRLGLKDGKTYTLHFYYAQRNPHVSVFRMRTNMLLETQQTFTVTAGFD